MEELQIKVSNNLGSISVNFDEIEATIKAVAENYKGIIVTEDTVKESKKDVAQLRKVIKEIEDSRKSVKKEWNKPYVEFEERCKKLESIIESPLYEIQCQIAEFEQQKLNEKKERFNCLYAENIEDLGNYISFESVLSDKWQNISYTEKDFLFDLSEKKARIKSDLAAIQALNSEILEEVITAYQNAGNSLRAAIAKNSDYIKAKELAQKRLEEEKQLEAERKAREEEQKKVEEQIATIPEEGFMNPPLEDPIWEEPAEETFIFRITGSKDIQKVKEMLDFADIKYVEV